MKAEFYSLSHGIGDIPHPVKSSRYIPEWFSSINRSKIDPIHEQLVKKKLQESGMPEEKIQQLRRWMEPYDIHNIPTIKACPGVIDWLKCGFIISAWTDFSIKISQDGFEHEVGDSTFKDTCCHMPSEQFASHTNSAVKHTLSLYSPWWCKTPPGYSLMQLPLLYHFHPHWSCSAGMLSTDVYHSLNQQLLITCSEGSISIPKGTPLVMYVPFQRGKWEVEVRSPTQEETENQQKIHKISHSGPGKATEMYRKMEKTGSRCPFMKIKNFLSGNS